jgi:hypothetical protein
VKFIGSCHRTPSSSCMTATILLIACFAPPALVLVFVFCGLGWAAFCLGYILGFVLVDAALWREG